MDEDWKPEPEVKVVEDDEDVDALLNDIQVVQERPKRQKLSV